MKKIFVTLLLVATIISAYAVKADTTKTAATQTAPPQQKTEDVKKSKPADTAASKSGRPNWNGKDVEGADWGLVWSPVILFIIGVGVINYRAKDFKLQDALAENTYPLVTEQNPVYTVAAITALPAGATPIPPTITVNKTDAGLPKSSSRYLALITTSLTLIIAACLTSCYIFIYLSSGMQPEFNHLGDVLLALGIGVTPYAFNKVATAVNNK
jgi:hypothetical protein